MFMQFNSSSVWKGEKNSTVQALIQHESNATVFLANFLAGLERLWVQRVMGVTQTLGEVSSFHSGALLKHAEFITQTAGHIPWLCIDYNAWENNIIKPKSRKNVILF